MNRILLFALTPLSLLLGCGDAVDDAMFSNDNARAVVQQFVVALEEGRYGDAVKLCSEPFSFRGQEWTGPLEANLKARAADILTAGGKTTSVQVYSYRELMAGQWPRGREVPENERSSEARDLGLKDEGFLVLTFEERRPGMQFVVNPDASGTMLRVAGVTP